MDSKYPKPRPPSITQGPTKRLSLSLDGIRGEVSNKIRSAVKAKLMELGAYVDDELPDYIMVMVANKRSRQQMEEDLQLFLGDSTSTFTNWLHTVLSKLQQVTVNNTEIKKAAEKKRPSSDECKKDKRKKPKKENDKDKSEKDDKIQGKEKSRGKESEDSSSGLIEVPSKERPIKSEPAEPSGKDVQPYDHTLQSNIQSSKSNTVSSHEKKSSESKGNEEEDDDDFINLKADVEADMWGDPEESSGSALKSLEKRLPAPSRSEVGVPEPAVQECHTESTKSPVNKEASDSLSLKDTLPSQGSSPSKTAVQEPKQAPRIIKISETIRQEQETLKPASKVVRDPKTKVERSPPSPIIFSTNLSEKSADDLEVFGRRVVQELRSMSFKQCDLAQKKILQALAKRIFQSHIVSQRNTQEKLEKLRRRSSSSTDNHNRRSDHRSTRKHDQQDLRDTIRKERQKEREHGRERDRDQRRSRDKNQSRKPNVIRPSSSENDENGTDPTLLSVVRVKPRPQIPAAMQANRSLILKAVAEAQKSVAKVVVRSELSTTKISPKQNKKNVKDRLQLQKQLPPNKDAAPLKQLARLPSREKLKRMSFTVVGKRAAPSKESLVAEFGDGSEEGSIILDPSLNILIQVPASPVGEEFQESSDPIQTEKVRRWIKDVEEATKFENLPPDVNSEQGTDTAADVENFVELETVSKHASEMDPEDLDDALDADTTSLKTSDIHSGVVSENQPIQRNTSKTQFVVTLDGLDPMLLRSFALESESNVDNLSKPQMQSNHPDGSDEDEENLLRKELVKEQLLREELLRQQAAVREQKSVVNHTVAVPPVSAPLNPAVKRSASPCSSAEVRPSKVISAGSKSSSLERCKFWPACKNGEQCEFLHPSTTCKLFPNCKFGDRCLYIHPTCRFNSGCSRSDCPYTHTGPRPIHSSAPIGPCLLGSQTSIKQACKFFPNCSNPSCPFIHPTVCKFGTHCTKPKCPFIHSDKGLITKHKWVRH